LPILPGHSREQFHHNFLAELQRIQLAHDDPLEIERFEPQETLALRENFAMPKSEKIKNILTDSVEDPMDLLPVHHVGQTIIFRHIIVDPVDHLVDELDGHSVKSTKRRKSKEGRPIRKP
jgi:hypothetical protein